MGGIIIERVHVSNLLPEEKARIRKMHKEGRSPAYIALNCITDPDRLDWTPCEASVRNYLKKEKL